MDDLIRRARGDGREAWECLFDACYPPVLDSIRLDGRMRHTHDPADVANEVFRRLLGDTGRLDCGTLDELIAHLVADAHSLVDEMRRGL